MRIRDIFWYGSVLADPYLWLTDPDPTPETGPAIFIRDLQDGIENYLKKKFFAYYL